MKSQLRESPALRNKIRSVNKTSMALKYRRRVEKKSVPRFSLYASQDNLTRKKLVPSSLSVSFV